MKKNKCGKVCSSSIMIGAVIVTLSVIYLIGYFYYSNHFYNNTYINGIECSNKGLEAAEKEVTKTVSEYKLQLLERGEKIEEITGEEIGLHLMFDVKLSTILEEQSPLDWFLHFFKKNEYENPSNLVYDEVMLEDRFKELDCVNPEKVKQPVDAKLSEYSAEGYKIVKEEQGNQLKEQEVYTFVEKAVMALEPALDLEQNNFYVTPNVYESDERLIQQREIANQYTNTRLEYNFCDVTEVVDGDLISQWLLFGEDFSVIISEDKVKEFVDYLGKTYNTFGKSRNFKTSYGQDIVVKGGDYGWWMNRGAEKNEIIECIKKGEQKVKEPVYFQKAKCYGNNDIGPSYVEINLEKQHLFFYKDGQLVVESDFVSGNIAKNHGTPTGTFPILYKEKNAVLKGEDYESDVKYWMPFYNGVGLHDASWRKKFGGQIYKKSGSHGCVNLPENVTKIIFDNIEVGTAVICY